MLFQSCKNIFFKIHFNKVCRYFRKIPNNFTRPCTLILREKNIILFARALPPLSPSPSFLLARKTDLRQVHQQLVSHRNSSPCQQFRSRQRNPSDISLQGARPNLRSTNCDELCTFEKKGNDRPHISNLRRTSRI